MQSWAELFGLSPFEPLVQHMHAVTRCSAELPALFAAVRSGNAEQVRMVHQNISRLEDEADDVKNDLRRRLPRTVMLPVDRRDLLIILDIQDSIANLTEDVADAFLTYDLSPPETVHEPLEQLVNRVGETLAAGEAMYAQLNHVVEAGFSGPEADALVACVQRVGALEDAADHAELALKRVLYNQRNDMNPVEVMIWMKIAGRVGELADSTLRVANRLLLLVKV